jgi:hypothetical protein
MIYTNAPFAAGTKYKVSITGTYVGGAIDRSWTFTTK